MVFEIDIIADDGRACDRHLFDPAETVGRIKQQP
jgi:hypothetical protein